jgi:hypothetical protein
MINLKVLLRGQMLILRSLVQ